MISRHVFHASIGRLSRGAGALMLVAGAVGVLAVSGVGELRPHVPLPWFGNTFDAAVRLPAHDPATPLRFLVIGGDADAPAPALEESLRGEARPEFVVLTGELVERATRERYELLRSRLAGIGCSIPVFAVKGERDAADLFEASIGRRVLHFEYAGCLFMLLDASAGDVDLTDLRAIERFFDIAPGRWRRTFAFVHRRTEGGQPVLSDFLRRRCVSDVFSGHDGGVSLVEVRPDGVERVERVGGGRGGWTSRLAGAWSADLLPRVSRHRDAGFASTAALLLGGALLVGWRRRSVRRVAAGTRA